MTPSLMTPSCMDIFNHFEENANEKTDLFWLQGSYISNSLGPYKVWIRPCKSINFVSNKDNATPLVDLLIQIKVGHRWLCYFKVCYLYTMAHRCWPGSWGTGSTDALSLRTGHFEAMGHFVGCLILGSHSCQDLFSYKNCQFLFFKKKIHFHK